MKKLLIMFIVIAMLFSFSFAANAENGVTEDSVKIGSFQALSGPVAFIGVSMKKGMVAYFNWINENGGVNGRDVDLLVVDDQFQPSKTVVEVKRMVEQDNIFSIVGGLGTPGCLAVMDYLNEKGVPFVYQGSGSSKLSIPPKNYIFSVQPNYITEAKLVGKYLTEIVKKRRIGMIYRADEAGKEAFKSLRDWLAENGMEDRLSRAIAVEPDKTSFDNEIIKLMQSGADSVYLLTFLSQTANILKQSANYGFEPLFVGAYPNADLQILSLAGQAAQGFESMAWVDLGDPESEVYQKYISIFQETYPEEIPDAYAAAGFIAAEIFTEALERAGEDPTRAKLVKALEGMDSWQGLITPLITYSEFNPDNEMCRTGLQAMYVMKIQGEEFVKHEDWIKLGE